MINKLPIFCLIYVRVPLIERKIVSRNWRRFLAALLTEWFLVLVPTLPTTDELQGTICPPSCSPHLPCPVLASCPDECCSAKETLGRPEGGEVIQKKGWLNCHLAIVVIKISFGIVSSYHDEVWTRGGGKIALHLQNLLSLQITTLLFNVVFWLLI